jgi:hypothetical protein
MVHTLLLCLDMKIRFHFASKCGSIFREEYFESPSNRLLWPIKTAKTKNQGFFFSEKAPRYLIFDVQSLIP